MLDSALYARLSVVFMIGFVIIFDRMHWRHRHCWAENHLMTQDESERILRILAASQNPGDRT
jgi:hypothetical protein